MGRYQRSCCWCLSPGKGRGLIELSGVTSLLYVATATVYASSWCYKWILLLENNTGGACLLGTRPPSWMFLWPHARTQKVRKRGPFSGLKYGEFSVLIMQKGWILAISPVQFLQKGMRSGSHNCSLYLRVLFSALPFFWHFLGSLPYIRGPLMFCSPDLWGRFLQRSLQKGGKITPVPLHKGS